MKERRPPNIILTIADDHRGAALGCAGIEPVATPNLDRLAARGTRYTQAQHLGSCHGAICAPSRAMLHTGRSYFELDASLLGAMRPPGDRTATVPPTLGGRLREAGYHTFATGKWHNGVHSFHPSFSSGANIFFGGMADHWFTPVYDFDATGEYPAGSRRTAGGFSTEVFAQSAMEFIRSRAGNDQPFFCYCAFTAPHDPRTPPDAWRRRYDPREMPLFPNSPAAFHNSCSPEGVMPARDTGSRLERDEILLGEPRDLRELQRTLAEYYGMISHMDEWIGKIHETVEEIGALENTMIIHTADHGLAAGQHGLLGKQNFYQHSLNVPLILAGPGIAQGQTPDDLCYQHDLHPTMLEWAGLNSDSCFQKLGESSRAVSGAAFQDTIRAIRNQRFKLIEYYVESARETELYDLKEDPWETRNLAGEPEHQATVNGLRQELRQWQGQYSDPARWI